MSRLALAMALSLALACSGCALSASANGSAPPPEALRAAALARKERGARIAPALKGRSESKARDFSILALVPIAAALLITLGALAYRRKAGAYAAEEVAEELVAPAPPPESAALAAAERFDFGEACVLLNRIAAAALCPDPRQRASRANRELERSLETRYRPLFRMIYRAAEKVEFGGMPANAEDWQMSLDAWRQMEGDPS